MIHVHCTYIQDDIILLAGARSIPSNVNLRGPWVNQPGCWDFPFLLKARPEPEAGTLPQVFFCQNWCTAVHLLSVCSRALRVEPSVGRRKHVDI